MQHFLEGWALFHDAWLTALLLALLLPFAGVVLVGRQQVFLGAAVGQAATGGLALALSLASWQQASEAAYPAHAVTHHAGGEILSLCFALGAGLLVAVLSMRALSAPGSSLEARTAWVFLFSGAIAVLLLSNAPHGMQDVQRLQLSSLLGASPEDVWIAATALLLTLLCVLFLRQRVLLWALDPPTAAALGFRLFRWDAMVGVWLGLVLGFAIHATGLLFAFGCAVLPVLMARQLCASLRALLWCAPVLGCAATAAGLYTADQADLPPGQVTVALQAALLPLAWLLRHRR